MTSSTAWRHQRCDVINSVTSESLLGSFWSRVGKVNGVCVCMRVSVYACKCVCVRVRMCVYECAYACKAVMAKLTGDLQKFVPVR